ncbi:solute carrier family 22 member 15-like [Rhipicephalus sanguineus]|uniref:solute carrier family 22 member 15-like n=1 Tax=Rhipicephalus sanguineus TaxID=34632 RepID=UPI0020C3A0CA|nr:solute carrier family 22 member 15-like [Rhipicephalus sanguineus]
MLSTNVDVQHKTTVEAGSLILSILAAAATVSTTDFASFVVARMLLTGSLGAVALAMGVAMFEASYSQRQRQLSVCFGHLVVSLVALLPRLLSSLMVLDRRAVCLAILLCAFAMFVMVLGGIEESPRWLRALFEAATSGDSKAQTSRTAMNRFSRGVSSILVRKYSKVMGKVRGRKQPTVSSVGLLFDQALRTRTLVLAFTLFALLNSLPALADEDVLSMERLNDVTRPMLRVCSIVAADQLLRECTRREALLLALPCVCVLVCAEAVAEATAAQSTLPLIRELLVNSILANLTMVCVYCLELYPTSARATGLGSVYFAGGVCATASPLLLTLRLERRLLQISTVPLTVAAMFVVTLLPETKDTPLPETLCDLEGTSRRLGSAEADDLLPEADTTTELPCRNRQPQPGQAPNVPHYSSISGARAFFD